jgi:hypothetical protein
VGLEAFRQRPISAYQLRSLLGSPSRDLDAFLRERQAASYYAEDFEHDLATLEQSEKTNGAHDRRGRCRPLHYLVLIGAELQDAYAATVRAWIAQPPPKRIAPGCSILRLHSRSSEFFTVHSANANMRQAYARALKSFLGCCQQQGVGAIAGVQPLHVAGYREVLRLQSHSRAPCECGMITEKLHRLYGRRDSRRFLCSVGLVRIDPTS